MALFSYSFVSPSCTLNTTQSPFPRPGTRFGFSIHNHNRNLRLRPLQSCFSDEPIIKEALKEPVAFVGGFFAGVLRLNLEEDPLKEWVTRTVEASGVKEEIDAQTAAKSEEEEKVEIE